MNHKIKKIVILQPYIATYRKSFFLGLSESLSNENVDLAIVHGTPDKVQYARRDAESGISFSRQVKSFNFHILSFTVRWISYFPYKRRASEGYIVEHSATNLNSWWFLIFHGRRTLLWGHAQPGAKGANPIDLIAEKIMCVLAKGVLTYTESGRDYLCQKGVDSSKIFCLRNAIDTTELSNLIIGKQKSESPETTALYIGGLDASKEIEFLLEAAEHASQVIPGFRLIIAGDGVLKEFVETKVKNNAYLEFVGRVDNLAKSHFYENCGAIWMPGIVGLVALDALTLQIPLITLTETQHPPEIEYLEEAGAVFRCERSTEEFVRVHINISKTYKPDTQYKIPTVESMIQNAMTALRSLLIS